MCNGFLFLHKGMLVSCIIFSFGQDHLMMERPIANLELLCSQRFTLRTEVEVQPIS